MLIYHNNKKGIYLWNVLHRMTSNMISKNSYKVAQRFQEPPIFSRASWVNTFEVDFMNIYCVKTIHNRS